MKDVSIIGVDLAKQVFQLHAATAEGEVVFRKKFSPFMQSQSKCQIAMEACATAHHWARTLMAMGHEVRLIAPKFVKPYVKNQKNDMADAEAIAEAASRPTMRFAEMKTPDLGGQQLDGLMMLAIGTPVYLMAGLALTAAALRGQPA